MTNQQPSRFELLNLLYRQLLTWDGTSAHANEIIGKNKSLLTELKIVDEILSQPYSDTEQQHVASIVKAHKDLLDVIKKDRTAILQKMKQVNQKDKIVNNYYSSFQQSIFVDKGM